MAAASIIRDWEEWDQEAGEIADEVRSHAAGEAHLLECVTTRLRQMYANHSKEKK